MARAQNKLSTLEVKRDLPPGLYGDGNGLYLQVSPAKTKSWIFRYMVAGRARKMGLGSVARISLADARKKAQAASSAIVDGVDPIDARKAQKGSRALAAAKAITFRQCAEGYLKANVDGWKNEKHRAQWTSTLSLYAYPVFGDLPVAAIDTGLVLKVLEPMWSTKPETASRLRGRIETILNWAKVREYRQGDNPARWRGHLDGVLPKRSKIAKVQHHAALPYAELPAFVSELQGREGISARALEFTVLTASRTGEVVGARWSEIDFDSNSWNIPAARMKAGREHRVPLSPRVVEILKALPREDEFVFPGGKKAGKPLSSRIMLKLMGKMRPGLTVHGFRSSFRDWAEEQTAYPDAVKEMALAHAIGNKVEAAYRRGDLFERRAKMMADWATFCTTPRLAAANLVKMRERV